MRIVPFTEARAKLPELLDAAEEQREHILITRKGRPSAVVISAQEFESIEETIEVVKDHELMAALKRSEADVKAGRLSPLHKLQV